MRSALWCGTVAETREPTREWALPPPANLDNEVVYHVKIWPASAEQQLLQELYAINLTEPQLRARFVEPYDHGQAITWQGRTLPADDIATITVYRSDESLEVRRFGEYDAIKHLPNVTNEFIVGAPGHAAPTRLTRPPDSHRPDRDPLRVMVVHGRNIAVRNAMFGYLRSLGLQPIEWAEAVAATGQGAPHNFDAVRAAMEVAEAVVVVLTAEDRAGLLPDLSGGNSDDDTLLRGQPRQNVVIEAGLAMGIDRSRTLLVEVGEIRRASDFDGMNTVRIDNGPATRADLRQRLMTAGCAVNQTANDWADSDASGDFESTVIPWESTQVDDESEHQDGPVPERPGVQAERPELFLIPRAIAHAGPDVYDNYVEVTNHGTVPARDLQVKALLHDQVVAASEPRNVHPMSVSEFVLTVPFPGSLDELRRAVSFVATDRHSNEWLWDA
jgi:predicted nucleotide-binding protein